MNITLDWPTVLWAAYGIAAIVIFIVLAFIPIREEFSCVYTREGFREFCKVELFKFTGLSLFIALVWPIAILCLAICEGIPRVFNQLIESIADYIWKKGWVK